MIRACTSRRSAGPAIDARRRILVWTTTPWTLVSTRRWRCNPELTYVVLTRKKKGAGNLSFPSSSASST